MSPSTRSLAGLSVAAFVGIAAACVSSAPAMPVAPTVDFAAAPDGSTLLVTAPSLQAPVGDPVLGQPPYTLVASPATGLYAQAPFSYRVELHDSNGILVEDSGPISSPVHTIGLTLDQDQRYTWRVRAEWADGVGPWSATGSFFTPAKPPSPCAHVNDPIGIIGCWQSILWDDSPGPGEHAALVKAVAKELNRAGWPGGPFGALVKIVGNNCEGYSCDIICAGQDGDQDQYDFLIDDHFPVWGPPNNGSEIRADVCEIQFPD